MAQRMTGPQKAAILLLSLGEDAAAEVLKNLQDDEIAEVSRQMVRMEEVSGKEVDRVANEFYRVAERGHFLPQPPETRIEYLKRLLGKAVGERSEGLVEGLIEQRPKSSLERLKWHHPSVIAEVLADENPQIIAVILTRLGEPDLALQVTEHLPEPLQTDVRERMARVRAIPEEWLKEVEDSLSEELFGGQPGGKSQTAAAGKAQAAPQTAADGSTPMSGQERVAGVLNAAPKGMEAQLIRYIQNQDPQLADKIRKRLFTFEDFIRVDDYGVQLVLRRTPMEDLVLALRLADEVLRRHFYRNLSDEASKQVQAALASLGPTQISQVEAAQKRMATTARQLQNTGELYLLKRRSQPVRTEG